MKRTSAIFLSLIILISVCVTNRDIDFKVKAIETPIQEYKIKNCFGISTQKKELSVFEQVSLITKKDISSMKIISVYTPPSKKTYTDDDLFCMAAVIYNEHGGNKATDWQRIADGNVVLNRIRSGKFAKTIRGVLESKGQYAGFENGVKFPKRATYDCEKEAVQRAYDIAKRVLEGEKVCPDDIVYQSEHKNLGIVWKKVGNTYYSRMKS